MSEYKDDALISKNINTLKITRAQKLRWWYENQFFDNTKKCMYLLPKLKGDFPMIKKIQYCLMTTTMHTMSLETLLT